MRFREIRIREVQEIRKEQPKPEDSNYLKIKPETDISTEECYAFWDSIFGKDDTTCRESDHVPTAAAR